MAEIKERTIILNKKQISQKITRIAHEIYENNFQEKSICIMGIHGDGYALADRIAKSLKKIADFEIEIFKIEMDKKETLNEWFKWKH